MVSIESTMSSSSPERILAIRRGTSPESWFDYIKAVVNERGWARHSYVGRLDPPSNPRGVYYLLVGRGHGKPGRVTALRSQAVSSLL